MTNTSKKILVIAGACLFLFTMLRYVLVVRQVVCTVADENSVCPETVVIHLQSILGKPLLFSDIPELAAQSVADEAYTVSGISRELPDTFRVEFTPAEYSFGILVGERSLVVTSANMILERPAVVGLPTIHVSESLIPPDQMPTEEVLLISKTVLSTLQSQSLSFNTIQYVSAQELQIDLQDPQITVIVNPSSAEEQLKAVPVLLNSPELQELPEPVTELDMRFKLPVVRTKQPST